MLFTRKPRAKSLTPAGAFSRPKFRKVKLQDDEFKKWLSTSTASVTLPSNALQDKSSFMKKYFELVARYVPTASDATWTWTYLCNTQQKTTLEGGTETQRNAAKKLLSELDKRLTPIRTVKNGGLNFLTKLFFSSLFTYGRFSGQLVLDANLKGVETFKILDPFRVLFDKDLNSYYQSDEKKLLYTQNNHLNFYYYGLEMSHNNPYGHAMVESCRTLISIAKNMMTDMALSSSNAGVPRLHIKIEQPQQYDWEDAEDYRSRISSYFSDTVSQFTDIGPDDNIYSWSDVTVAPVMGASGPGGFVWRTNRSVVDEEIISGYHLYPWILGRSFSTTKNWVRSQFDILMSQVSTLQTEAKRFAEWISNTHLALNGLSEVKAKREMIMPRDPAIKEIAVAENYRQRNVDFRVKRGIISADDGARELGYEKAENPDLWLSTEEEKGDLGDNQIDDTLTDMVLKLEEIHSLVARNSYDSERHGLAADA